MVKAPYATEHDLYDVGDLWRDSNGAMRVVVWAADGNILGDRTPRFRKRDKAWIVSAGGRRLPLVVADAGDVGKPCLVALGLASVRTRRFGDEYIFTD